MALTKLNLFLNSRNNLLPNPSKLISIKLITIMSI